VQRPTTAQDGFLEAIPVLILGQDVIAEPGAQRLGVFHSGFPEAEALPDLSALVLDGPPLPAIPGPFGWVHADLAGKAVDNDVRDLLGAQGKASFVLERT
jgi:hypothetical protein